MATNDFLQFGGRPLVRSGENIVYGSPWERFYCKLKLVDISDKGGYDAASEVHLVILDNTEKKQVVRKKCEDLGSAILFAKNWLDMNEK